MVGYHMQYTLLLLERIPNDNVANNYTYNEYFFFCQNNYNELHCNAKKVCGLYLR